MTTVLVTAAGGGIGVGAIQSIRRAGPYRIVGVDVEPKAGGLYRCDERYALPPVTDDRWASRFADVVRSADVDVVVPLIDAELVRIDAVRRRVPDDVSFLVSRDDVISIAFDKFRTSEYLADLDVLVPELVTGDDLGSFPDAAYPAVVKPRTGQGNSLGSGVDVVEDEAAARGRIEDRDVDPSSLVVEEFVSGTEYTTEVIGTTENELLGIVPKEAVSSDPYHRVTRDAPRVRDACETLFQKLQPAGVVNVQQIVSDAGIYTFEINPRFSASSSLTAASGVNGFDLAIRDALGEPVDPPSGYQSDLHLFRYPESVYVESPLSDP